MINLTKKQLAIIVVIGAIIVFVIGYYIYKHTLPSENYEELDIITQEKITTETEETKKEEKYLIVVHIAGEVVTPGIVKIEEGARIADVIEKAGGLTSNADLTNINLAYIIEDGQKITIPAKKIEEDETNAKETYISTDNGEGIIDQTETNKKTSEASEKININKATKEELQTISGIGESTATKIIEYREENGSFDTIEDIKNVSGIGDAKYNAIKDRIKVK